MPRRYSLLSACLAIVAAAIFLPSLVPQRELIRPLEKRGIGKNVRASAPSVPTSKEAYRLPINLDDPSVVLWSITDSAQEGIGRLAVELPGDSDPMDIVDATLAVDHIQASTRSAPASPSRWSTFPVSYTGWL